MRGLRNDGGVTEEEMGEAVPRGWRNKAFRHEEVSASGNSDREVLAAAETTNRVRSSVSTDSIVLHAGTEQQ